MTLKKFKSKIKRKQTEELKIQLEEIRNTLQIAIQYYMETPTNNIEDLKYIRQLRRKVKIIEAEQNHRNNITNLPMAMWPCGKAED